MPVIIHLCKATPRLIGIDVSLLSDGSGREELKVEPLFNINCLMIKTKHGKGNKTL